MIKKILIVLLSVLLVISLGACNVIRNKISGYVLKNGPTLKKTIEPKETNKPQSTHKATPKATTRITRKPTPAPTPMPAATSSAEFTSTVQSSVIQKNGRQGLCGS